jgi:hypothetical protein
MSYGDPEWSGNWVLAEEEASKHIKAAYVLHLSVVDFSHILKL